MTASVLKPDVFYNKIVITGTLRAVDIIQTFFALCLAFTLAFGILFQAINCDKNVDFLNEIEKFKISKNAKKKLCKKCYLNLTIVFSRHFLLTALVYFSSVKSVSITDLFLHILFIYPQTVANILLLFTKTLEEVLVTFLKEIKIELENCFDNRTQMIKNLDEICYKFKTVCKFFRLVEITYGFQFSQLVVIMTIVVSITSFYIIHSIKIQESVEILFTRITNALLAVIVIEICVTRAGERFDKKKKQILTLLAENYKFYNSEPLKKSIENFFIKVAESELQFKLFNQISFNHRLLYGIITISASYFVVLVQYDNSK
ncbi:hypothetical protein PVAND_013228 [Polypedilum vanderplanki]|uniref:Gustatory receptor n=1 Tax=Polypedilum vanderplanki TaxID=319348 RepID=A0A9J6CPQ9_POLVA|nr:hypothetical protein PVAND_013228 [Polypedilum vanderplanki]